MFLVCVAGGNRLGYGALRRISNLSRPYSLVSHLYSRISAVASRSVLNSHGKK